MGFVTLRRGDPEAALPLLEKAIGYFPGSAIWHHVLAAILNNLGDAERALRENELAFRLDPAPPPPYYQVHGDALAYMGRFGEASAQYKECLNRIPTWRLCHIGAIVAYQSQGDTDRAAAQVKTLHEQHPEFTIDGWLTAFGLKGRPHVEPWVDRLREAGMDIPPEGPKGQ